MSARPLRRGNWSVQELTRLRQLLPWRGVAATAALLRRSPESVERKAVELLRTPARRGAFAGADDQLLRDAWGAVDARLLGVMLGRTPAEVRSRAAELRTRPLSGPWTSKERLRLKRLYGTRSDADLEVCMLRRVADLTAMARDLCLAKDKRHAAAARPVAPAPSAAVVRTRMSRWAATEVARLREIYPTLDNLAVAKALGRTVTSVANKANQLGLHKDGAVLAAIGRANVSRRYRPAEDVTVVPVPSAPARHGDADAAAVGG
ncbi:MAG: hypothetical protein FJ306_02025 [Planctomycetes bacterium]|nr:hypothetical protein [Planctomycetota bacterium]